jgi:hypothetical protein
MEADEQALRRRYGMWFCGSLFRRWRVASAVVTCQPAKKANHLTERQLVLPEPPPPDETKTVNTLKDLRRMGLPEKPLSFLAKQSAVTWAPPHNRRMQQEPRGIIFAHTSSP